jgi:hypothetical protein
MTKSSRPTTLPSRSRAEARRWPRELTSGPRPPSAPRARAYHGQRSRWYQPARQKAGRITAAGMTKEVGFEPVEGAVNGCRRARADYDSSAGWVSGDRGRPADPAAARPRRSGLRAGDGRRRGGLPVRCGTRRTPLVGARSRRPRAEMGGHGRPCGCNGCRPAIPPVPNRPQHTPDLGGILLAGRAVLGGAESFIITGATTWGLVRAGAHNAGKVIAWMGTAVFAALAVGAPLGTVLYAKGGFGAVALAATAAPIITLAHIISQCRGAPVIASDWP